MAETSQDFQYPAVIAQFFGTWEGKSVHMSPEGEVLDTYSTKIEIGVKGRLYSQRNSYTWPDGRKTAKEYPGEFDPDGKLFIWVGSKEVGYVKGTTNYLSDQVMAFTEDFRERKILVSEFITMCPDKKSRMRTNQILKDGKPWKVSCITETLVSKDDVYFEINRSQYEKS